MSDWLHPDEPQLLARESEARPSAVSGNSCENPNRVAGGGQDTPPTSTTTVPDPSTMERPVDSNRVTEAVQASGEDGWLGEVPSVDAAIPRKPMAGPRKGRRLVRRNDAPRTPFNAEQRLLILDS